MKTLTIAALAVISASTLAQDWSIGANYDLRDKTTRVVAATKFDTLWAGTGKQKGLTLDLSSLVGGSEQDALYGGMLGVGFDLLPRIRVNLGLSITKMGSSFQDLFGDFNFNLGVGGSVMYTFPVRL